MKTKEDQIKKEENALIRKQLEDDLLTSKAIERNTKIVKTKVNRLNYSESFAGSMSGSMSGSVMGSRSPINKLTGMNNDTESLNPKYNFLNPNKQDYYIEMIDRWDRNKFNSKLSSEVNGKSSPHAVRKMNHD